MAVSGLFNSWVSARTVCSSRSRSSSRSRISSTATARSPSSPGSRGTGTRSPACTCVAYDFSLRTERTIQIVTSTPTAADRPSNQKPATKIRRCARSMNCCTVASGLPTVTTPITRSPSRTGAATYITELPSSPGSVRVARAPYSPRKVRWTSRHCE